MDPASRLFQNLLDNAFKYGRPGGRVWVTLRREQGEFRSACGMRDRHSRGAAEKIWQRFYQVDPARSSDRGAGLGLAMVQQIAEVHGGRMTLESAAGAGSAFTLHLPEHPGK
ncbi:MAG: sensor histidine kinase [Oscillospiraceae bacterium]